ncbi:MAG: tetratricopeptide repeat protein [bacterium]
MILRWLSVITVVVALNVPVSAQETVSGRFRVLVPQFLPMNDEDDGFGDKLADRLRDQIDELNTHAAVSERDINNQIKEFKIKKEDVNCITARQLAAQAGHQVVLCAQYSGSKEAYEVQNIKFVSVDTGEEYSVDNVMSADKQEEAAATQIVDRFTLFVEQQRVAVFCGDYAASQQWESALENCDRALELNPSSNTSRFTRASVLRQTDDLEGALGEIKILLESDPYHQEALLLGGFLAINLNDPELARGYYRNFLQLDPTNATVRMRVAYDAAQAGDPLGAMEIIQEGVDAAPANTDFHEQLGNFAFAGAQNLRAEAALDGGDGVTEEVVAVYRRAIAAYEKVFEVKGAETLVSQLRNTSAAYLQLGEAAQSAEFSRRALVSHSQETSIWNIYAQALKELGQVDEAIAALSEIEVIDPEYPNLLLRMASWLLEVNDIDQAIPILQKSVGQGSDPDQAGTMIFGRAYSNYIQPDEKNYSRFIVLIRVAKDFQVTTETREQYDFWHGFSLYNLGLAAQLEETVASAERSLPMFREALSLFQESKGYADRTPSINYAQFSDASTTYIEIQEAIIKRGG